MTDDVTWSPEPGALEPGPTPQQPVTDIPTPDTPPEAPTVTPTRPEIPAYIIAAIAIICIAVLTGLDKTVPDVLNLVTIGALGIGGAITTPNGKGSS